MFCSFPISEKIQPIMLRYWHLFSQQIQQNNSDHTLHLLLKKQPVNFFNQMIRTWIGSDFCAEQCIKNPQLVSNFLQDLTTLIEFTPDQHEQNLKQIVSNIEDETSLMSALRIYRNHQLVRIIWRDINKLSCLEKTVKDLSMLAEACVEHALTWLYKDSIKIFGTPMNERQEKQKMVVIAMGKLGANELNLSSDIDLIFTYPQSGQTQGAKKRIDNKEFFIRLGQRLIKVLDTQTEHGFVFRVDMRLRPYGSSGALNMSFSAMEQYYQDQGRDWERYAMIKARPIAGDIKAGYELLHKLKPFVYRRYLDFSAIESLRDMKQKIERTIKKEGIENNIKRGAGGIRELEFIIQVYQLIHGGRQHYLQSRSLLATLDSLKRFEYIEETAAEKLKQAYIYLRCLEHALQALNDQQIQDLPKNTLAQERIAFSLNHTDWNDLIHTLNEHKQSVTIYFKEIIAITDDSQQNNTHLSHWNMLWNQELSKNQEITLLQKHGFTSPDEAHQRFIALRDGKALTKVRRQSRSRLNQFIPVLMEQIISTKKPDTCLNRVFPLIENILRRTVYLVLLMENPKALKHLCQLCTASSWIAEQIAQYPIMLDEFLRIKNLYMPPKKKELMMDLEQQLLNIPENDLESQMEVLRHFKMAHTLRVAAAEIAQTMPLMKASDYLTWIAESILEMVTHIAWRNLASHYQLTTHPNLINFAIIGYGKLGSIELGPSSDLDLVFIHGGQMNSNQSIDNHTFFTRLGQRIIHMLTTQTTSGILYDTDMRLRPSGKSGLLVTSIEAFEKYQQEKAWTWEHQALVRARPVAGDIQLAKKFQIIRKKILCKKRDVNILKKAIKDMRQKMRIHLNDKTNPLFFHLKNSHGGIIDIEFLMQFAVLAYAHKYEKIIYFTDNIRISELLESNKIITHQQGVQIRDTYKKLRKIIHYKSFQNKSPIIDLKFIETQCNHIKTIWYHWIGEDNQTNKIEDQ